MEQPKPRRSGTLVAKSILREKPHSESNRRRVRRNEV